jgi:3'-phosphoadenosine 5'-phosphosulfate sulfotransferase (PAPS reductase)/FAD synthetase
MTESDWKGLSRHRPPAATFDFGRTDDIPFEHDPLNPHPEQPTPIELVVRLTASERETRVAALERMAWNRFDEAVDILQGKGKTITSFASLVSGGNDSYTVAHLFRSVTTHQVHANTQTGIEATRQFVRATAEDWGVPLIEKLPKPGEGYFDLVRGNVWAVAKKSGQLEQSWPGGFPGPAAHAVMQIRLKARALEQVPHALGISGSRTERVLFIAGRRRSESKRRRTVPHYEPDGSIKTIEWASPIAVWHKADLRAYRLQAAKQGNPVPSNPVAQILGMSGECGCLANASDGEPDLWRKAYPNDPFILKVAEVEEEIKDRADIPKHMRKWGWNGLPDAPELTPEEALLAMRLGHGPGDLCSTNCGPDPILDGMDPLFEWEAA